MSIQTNNLPDNPQIEVIKSGKTGLFTNYIFKAIPLAFDESMSYYETLCGLLNYLKNVIIPTVNNNANAVAELQTLYEQLRTYVENYFTNLDVQDEINNKLDKMVEDGTIPEIIASYLNSKAVFGFDNVASMKNNTNLINGSYAETLGYYSKNDGGGATYKITSEKSETEYQEKLNNELYATLIIDNELNVKQFGAKCNGVHDDSNMFKKCVDFAILKNLPIKIIGTLTLTSPYELTQLNTTLTIYGYGNGNTFSPEYVSGNVSNVLLKENTRFISGVNYTTTNGNYPKLSINLSGINFYSENSGEKYIFENIYLTGSLIKNNSSHYVGLIKGTLAVSSVVDSNKFVGLTCFMERGSVSARELFSDSVIINNYISGLNNGYCFKNPVCGNMRIKNNFIDYFKTIYGNANMGGTLLSEGNIYDGYCYIIEGSDTVQMGQFSSVNDKYFTHTKSRCIELGYITNDDIKCSFNIKTLNYNIEVINPKIRYDTTNECDESFIYGSVYSPTAHLKIALINPSYCNNDGNAVANARLNINKLINVRLSGSTIAQVFANSGIAYQPARIDTLPTAPDIQRNNGYILPPWYRYFNTTDNKLYEFSQDGTFKEVYPTN